MNKQLPLLRKNIVFSARSRYNDVVSLFIYLLMEDC